MLPWLDAGNPSSQHADGRRARAAMDRAREQISASLGVEFGEFLFTSGGTEAANLAIIGTALAAEPGRRTILIGAAEHHCGLDTIPVLERLGFAVHLIPVDQEAAVSPAALQSLLTEDVALVSVMHANNEVGTIQPIPTLAELAHEYGALFHTDAVQTFRKFPWTVAQLGADLVTISSHKISGPKGIGGIVIRAGVKIAPLVRGGGQEREMRGGTENVAAAVGFGEAAARPIPPYTGASDQFRTILLEAGAIPTVREASFLPSIVHVRFPGISAETLLIRLDREGISASAGAACSSGSLEASHVLRAAGYDETTAREGVRFSLGLDADPDEMVDAAHRITATVRELRRR